MNPKFQLDAETLIKSLGFEKLTEIQEAAIPTIASGKSVFALAPTGSGKTFAYLVPLMMRAEPLRQNVQILILAPTRELGAQIAQCAGRVSNCLLAAADKTILVRTAFGGQKIDSQITEITKNPQILVATPGRALDLVQRGVLNLEHVRALVIDEADHMLSLGFEGQMQEICSYIGDKVQTAFISATESTLATDLFEKLIAKAMRIDVRGLNALDENAFDQSVVRDSSNGVNGSRSAAIPLVTHHYAVAEGSEGKANALIAYLKERHDEINTGILFCQTREGARVVSALLSNAGISSESLSGELGQVERTSILRRFKAGGFRFMVATNIAARGIDVDQVSVVINYDLPSVPEEYIHRVGRSGRAGNRGMVLSLCTPGTEGFFLDICSQVGCLVQKIVIQNSVTQASPSKKSALIKIHLNRGKSSKLRPGDIVGALIRECGFGSEEIGNIFIFDHFSHVELSMDKGKKLISAPNLRIKNMLIKASKADK